jgi:PhnB protein
MRVSPHLCFNGQCREAFEMYQSLLGGTLETMLTYGESPMASSTDPSWHDRSVHATLLLDEVELMGVDMVTGSAAGLFCNPCRRWGGSRQRNI